MIITALDFKNNFDKYLDIVEKEDITVTMNGKIVGVFSSSNINPVEQLCGILEGYDYYSEDDIKKEKLKDNIKSKCC